MRNRILLIGLTIAAWVALKIIDIVVPWPTLLFLLSLTVTIMITHTVWLLIAQGRWRRRVAKGKVSTEPENDNWEPWVDIFIAAKNESRVIETTIRNFFKLDYSKFYLWIIDDASDDATPQVVERLQQEFPNLRLLRRIPGSRPGKSAALNEALPLAKGEVVVVFDADAYVAPDFLKLTLPVLAPEGVGAVQSQKRIYQHQKGMLVDCQSSEYAMDTYFQMGRDLIGGTVELRGNGQLLKRAALIDVGGWNNMSITDDLDLTMRLLVNKWDVRFCPHAHVWEEAVTTLKGLIRQRRRWAEGSIRRYLDYIFPLNSPSRLSLVERLDLLVFVSEFAVPALMVLELISEMVSFATGGQTHGRFLLLIAAGVAGVSLVNSFIAIRIYRQHLNLWKAAVHAVQMNVYLYAHWIPVVMFSFVQILSGRQASKWHPTEHVGSSTT